MLSLSGQTHQQMQAVERAANESNGQSDICEMNHNYIELRI